jgi:hypothetical protein
MNIESDSVRIVAAVIDDGSETSAAVHLAGPRGGALFGERLVSPKALPPAFEVTIRWDGNFYPLVVAGRDVALEEFADATSWTPLPLANGLGMLWVDAQAWRARHPSGDVTSDVSMSTEMRGNRGCSVIDVKRLPNGEPAGGPQTLSDEREVVHAFGQAPDQVLEAVGRNSLGELDPLPAGHEQSQLWPATAPATTPSGSLKELQAHRRGRMQSCCSAAAGEKRRQVRAKERKAGTP